jgi:hypothetical protein
MHFSLSSNTKLYVSKRFLSQIAWNDKFYNLRACEWLIN